MTQRGAGQHQGLDSLLGIALGLAGALLTAGWLMPLMTVETFFIFEDQLTIFGALARLLESGEKALFILVGLFTVVFPVIKLILAFWLWWRLGQGDRRLPRYAAWVEAAGKWSMLDVFVVAILVVIIKVSLVSEVTLHAGLYVFAIAVIFAMVTVARITAMARRAIAKPSESKPSESMSPSCD